MSYVVIARKYRPQSFDDVVGQEHVATTLKNAIKSGRVAHAYLFAGPRGVGKTSMARILSKALNCEKGPTDNPCNQCDVCKRVSEGADIDVQEIDGASNRRIEEVRDLRQNARYAPSRSRFKIYIIDEVHMLTTEAFNALLKTLEEPPPHVKFIFATTDPHKVPETIHSRCQLFEFRRLSTGDIAKRLSQICEAEGVKAEDGVLNAIARAARGAVRDAQSLLDQLIAFCPTTLTLKDLHAILGLISEEKIFQLVDAFAGRNPKAALEVVHELYEQGKDVGAFLEQAISHLRDLMIASACGADSALIDVAQAGREAVKRQATLFTSDDLMYMLHVLAETKKRGKENPQSRVLLEMAVVKLATMESLQPLGEVLERLSAMAAGRPVAPSKPLPPPARVAPEAERPPVVRESPQPVSAPSSSPEPVKAPVPQVEGEIDLDRMKAIWPQIAALVRSRKPSVGLAAEAAAPARLENGRLVLGLSQRIYKSNLENGPDKKIVEDCIAEIIGKRLTLDVTLAAASAQPRNPKETPVGRAPSPEARDAGSPAQAMIRKAVELFDGRVVSTER